MIEKSKNDIQANECICAIVVTYNRPVLLCECLRALMKQTRAVEQILVVDNCSTDDTLQIIRTEFPDVQVLELPRNGGGAGGFHAGMQHAYAEGFGWLWVMDDDGRPAPDCLETLLLHRPHAPNEDISRTAPPTVLVPLQQDSDGRLYGFAAWNGWEVDVLQDVRAKRHFDGVPVFRFVGPLIPSSLVQKIGLPDKEFFIWFDDIEYSLRANRARADVVFVPEALFYHDFGGKAREVSFLGRRSLRNPQPPWKIYYGARNHLYALLRNRGNGRQFARDLLWYSFIQSKNLIGEAMYEKDRWQYAKMRFLGIRDGVLGRMGKRV